MTQKGETLTGKVTPMKNFAGGKVQKGDTVQGLVELPKKLDLFEPFKVTVGGQSCRLQSERRRCAGLWESLSN